MLFSLKSLINRIAASNITGLAVLSVAIAALTVNSLILGSQIIGILPSLVFLVLSASAVGRLFFSRESQFTRMMLGLTSFLSVMGFAGTALIFAGKFTVIISLVTISSISLGLYVASIVRRRVSSSAGPVPSSDSREGRRGISWLWSLVSLGFLLVIAVLFFMLLQARTGEGETSVWLTIPTLFVPMFFAASLLLGLVLVFARVGSSLKLVFVMAYSFLAHSLFLLVWYPGRYGDPWSHLAEARYIAKAGMPYAYEYLFRSRLFVDIVKYRAQQSIVVFFQRMFNVDIYWVHIILLPLLWAVFVPFLAYKTAELMSTKKSKTFPLLAAFSTGVFPSLVIWGAVSVPNSLGFIFFFLAVVLLLYWMRFGGKWVWLLVFFTSIVSFLAHPQSGIFAFMLYFWGTVVHKWSAKVLGILSYALAFAIYPAAMYYFDARYALGALLVLDNFLSFQTELTTILLVFGLVGLFLGVRGKYVSTKIALILFAFWATVAFEYYFTRYGMTNWPYGPGRILTMGDFLFAPFLALGLLTVVDAFRKMLSSRRNSLSTGVSSSRRRLGSGVRLIGIMLMLLFLALQNTSSLYRAYPHDEIVKYQPADYELQAISYISSTTAGTYAVICDPGFSSIATGFLGVDYSYYGGVPGWFGVPDYSYPLQSAYLQMLQSPSLSIMKSAQDFIRADWSYFVVSIKEPDFPRIVESVSNILPSDQVFGDGKLYVFKYPLPLITKAGPNINVVYEGTTVDQVPTTLSYRFRAEANYTATLSGHSSYNITDYQLAWTFLDLTVNNVSAAFDKSSQINTFIYKSGLSPSDVLKVTWLSSLDYPEVGWKEDSFNPDDWRQRSGNRPANLTSDGNILNLSVDFTKEQYEAFYYVRDVNISTSDYPYFIIRWKTTSKIGAVAIYYPSGEGETIVQLGSQSKDWTVTIFHLTENKRIQLVMAGVTNGIDYATNYQTIFGPQTMYVDYILLSKKAAQS